MSWQLLSGQADQHLGALDFDRMHGEILRGSRHEQQRPATPLLLSIGRAPQSVASRGDLRAFAQQRTELPEFGQRRCSCLTFRGSEETFRRNFRPRSRRPGLLRRLEFDQLQGLSLPGPQ
jgi:hypothetical protein